MHLSRIATGLAPVFRHHVTPKSPSKVETSPYPQFFKDIVKPPETPPGGTVHKALILSGGVKAKAVQIFIQVWWGGKVLKALKDVAQEHVRAPEGLRLKMELDNKNRESRLAYREQFNTEVNGQRLASLPPGRLDEYKASIKQFPKVSHSMEAQAHLESVPNGGQNCETIRSGDGNEWHALKITLNKYGLPKVEPKKISPTSERALDISNDLNNIYVHIGDDGHLTISCGVIDTREKAKQFMEAVAWALNERNKNPKFDKYAMPPLRINMHQLNSMGSGPGVLVSERSLIRRQHQQVDYINANLKEHLESLGTRQNYEHLAPMLPNDGPYVAHVNRCLNGFTQLKGEDENAHPVNREGIAVQMGWLHADLQSQLINFGVADTPASHYNDAQWKVNSTLEKLQAKKNDLAFFEDHLSGKDAQIKENKKEIERVEAEIIKEEIRILDLPEDSPKTEIQQLQRHLEGLKAQKKRLDKSVIPHEKESKEVIKNIHAEIHSLDLQLKEQMKDLAKAMYEFDASLIGQRQLSSEELRRQGLPDRKKLESIQSRIHAAAQIMAIQTEQAGKPGFPPKINPAEELAFQLIFDHMLGAATEINCKSGLDRSGFTRSLHNAIQQKLKEGKSYTDILQFVRNFEFFVKGMDAEVQARMQADPDFNFKEWLQNFGGDFKEFHDFQVAVFSELMGVARPITGRSSGIEGLKWHHDKNSLNPYEKNPHPIPFIPMFVLDEGTGKMVQLIRLNKKGQRELTAEGNAVLMGLSARRGG